MTVHKAALEAGTDPQLVAPWSRDAQHHKATAEVQLKQLTTASDSQQRMNPEHIHELVRALGGLLNILHKADPEDKAEVYHQLGLTMTYNPTQKMVLAETRPRPPVDQQVVSEGRVAH